MQHSTRLALLAALPALGACASSGDLTFPIRTLYELQWDCSGQCDLPFPYTGYEFFVLSGDEDADEVTLAFQGTGCDEAGQVTCALGTATCGSGGEPVEALECEGGLPACDAAGEALGAVVLCRVGSSLDMESEEIVVDDPDSDDQAVHQLRALVRSP